MAKKMGVDVIRDNSNKENKGRGCGGPKMSGWDNSSELRDEVLVKAEEVGVAAYEDWGG